MKKRIVLLTLFLVVCLSTLLGCKKNVGTSEDNAIIEEVEEEKETYSFGFTCLSMQNPYFITLEESLREKIEEEGHTLITKDPESDLEKQMEQIDEMIEDGIDAIFLHPVDWEGIEPALLRLKEAGVKIINIDCEVKAFDYVDAYVGSDNKSAGQLCALDLIEQFPNGGKIMILESITQNSVNDRIRGFEKTIAGKGFEIVARHETMGDLNTAREAAYQSFLEHPEIVAVMCGNDQSALGVVVAANTAGMKDVSIYGVDGSPDMKKELAKSDSLVRGTVAQSPISIGNRAAEVGIAILDGEDYEECTYEEVFFVDKDNVDMYGTDGWK